MAYALVLVFEGVTEEQYWSVNDKLGIEAGSSAGYPDGMLVHAAGPTPTGWMVSEVWESRAAQEKFMQGPLGEALGKVGVGAPAQVIDADTVNVQQPA